MKDAKNNTGAENTGENNSGNRNSGNGNSGYGNSTDRESGIFNMANINEILQEFDEKFPSQEILEAVDIGEGQADVVPVGIEFVNPPNPDKIKSFLKYALLKILQDDVVRG